MQLRYLFFTEFFIRAVEIVLLTLYLTFEGEENWATALEKNIKRAFVEIENVWICIIDQSGRISIKPTLNVRVVVLLEAIIFRCVRNAFEDARKINSSQGVTRVIDAIERYAAKGISPFSDLFHIPFSTYFEETLLENQW